MDDANRSLKKVISDHKEYIETTTKGPVMERAKVTDFGGIIVKEEQKVSTCGASLMQTPLGQLKIS